MGDLKECAVTEANGTAFSVRPEWSTMSITGQVRTELPSAHLRLLVTLGAVCVGWVKAGEMEMVSIGNAFKEIFREGVCFVLFCFLRNRVEREWLM